MKHDFMTDGYMQEIQELYANGHGEALNAYDRNVLKGAAVTATAFLVIRAIVHKVKQKSEDQKDFEE